ncbi:MgtC/SapB family protein [Microbulbifer halophilus]|uniref:MgtC/SapB family protein n=1 Tax=Microbulbifer halophilus TaxID=453963 RepID=A0ABW5EEB0_9GAMM|nr:MgtC/SapB family protein [Microbulbifer halophilus]MCW8127307.1 MgtC/SapB family protein [Microbulbifer halophilus]
MAEEKKPLPGQDAIPDPLQAFIDSESLVAFSIALGLGLLIGLQRERTTDRLGGIRTFPLIGLFGALSAHIARIHDSVWMLPAGLVCMTVLILLGNLGRLRGDEESTGITTEVTALLMYLLGAYLILGEMTVAVAVGGTIAVLLHLKPRMHEFANRLPERDLRSIMQFALISLIILPVLPNRTFGPYDVLNPFKIWLLVVLIVGIGLGGYGAYKLIGARAGTLLSGLIGGLISSTATTVSYARRAKSEAGITKLAALVILIASTSMFIRMFVEIAVVAPKMLVQLIPPLLALLLVSLVVCALGYRYVGQQENEMPEQSNPAELTPALIFGALYALVILAIAAAKEYFGHRGIYVVALISGFTDVDAITLSTANLAGAGQIETGTAWRAMVIAAQANMVFKAGVAGMLGGLALFKRVLLLFGVPFVAGLFVLFFWPDGAL